ncbi:hypothetical protein A3K79_06335 [Candidatus Bathyarchaeota archaeon RBG_13_46_16b]|nr:MAG: hypothetical protein A3K79_06335 [Candidatus Bathyarchaeota archaeon RBG_13_46_16b]
MRKRTKIELALAIAMAIMLSSLAVYVNQPRPSESVSFGARLNSLSNAAQSGRTPSTTIEVQQVVRENIEGELAKGSFETVVETLKNITYDYGGIIPNLNMIYENELWTGTLNCKIPTENVASFTFDARRLISANGKVTHISVSITETVVNQTGLFEKPLSEVSIDLKESADGGGETPIMNQMKTVASWLFTGLVWIAQGLIIGVPLCFVSLGIIVLADRGIIPAWRKMLKGKNTSKMVA